MFRDKIRNIKMIQYTFNRCIIMLLLQTSLLTNQITALIFGILWNIIHWTHSCLSFSLVLSPGVVCYSICSSFNTSLRLRSNISEAAWQPWNPERDVLRYYLPNGFTYLQLGRDFINLFYLNICHFKTIRRTTFLSFWIFDFINKIENFHFIHI